MRWKSPMSIGARYMAKVLRERLDALGWNYRREEDTKRYERFLIIVPMPMNFAHVFRFVITSPSNFTIDLYDTRPTHSALMPYIEIYDVYEENVEHVRTLLLDVLSHLPRKPWEFTLSQRLMNGLLLPDYRRARRMWSQILGFDVKKSRRTMQI
ncbi:MAG: hypothetical protein DRN20_05755 [Thermoplasmata archaeon]|nr:MAG: hypothetical protein DRN20_05755 [Thermoplasmata archaeon]